MTFLCKPIRNMDSIKLGDLYLSKEESKDIIELLASMASMFKEKEHRIRIISRL